MELVGDQDYQDPATYLNILDAKEGFCCKTLGITKVKIQKSWIKLDLMSTRNSWMMQHQKQPTLTNAMKNMLKHRLGYLIAHFHSCSIFRRFSDRESYSTIFKPTLKLVSKGDPFVFKGLELQNDIVTTKEYRRSS